MLETNRARWGLYGVFFGVAFPLIGLFIRKIESREFFDLTVALGDPLLQIIFTAPFFLGVFAYIGGLKKDEVDHLKRDLEKQVQAQTLALVQSTKLASLGEMASGVAHEINNPLAIIVGRVQLLLQRANKNLPEEQKGDWISGLQKIEQSSQRIARIVKSMRTLSRNAESDPLEPQSLERLVLEVLDLIQERLKGQDVEIRLTTIDSSLIVLCRSSEISQVLINLLQNAADAIENLDTRWIQIMGGVDPKPFLRIVDSGQGISADVLTRLMEPFFTTKQVGKGTGLGLSISRNIMKHHGGDLRYELYEGNTSFLIEFPV